MSKRNQIKLFFHELNITNDKSLKYQKQTYQWFMKGVHHTSTIVLKQQQMSSLTTYFLEPNVKTLVASMGP